MPDDLARLYVLEATIEILKTENEILKRRLAAAETWAAQAVITKRCAGGKPSQALVATAGGLKGRPSPGFRDEKRQIGAESPGMSPGIGSRPAAMTGRYHDMTKEKNKHERREAILAKKSWSGRGQAEPVIYADSAVARGGEALHPIFWQGREWAVTAYGIERRDGSYPIEASRLCEGHEGAAVAADGTPVPYTWIGHIGEKGWDLADFATAFFVACAMHGVRLSPAEVEMLRDQYGWRIDEAADDDD
jgi:hypothetical protein